MLNTLAVLILMIASHFAFSQQEAPYELTCRSKAKEIAAKAYKSCMADNKTAQLEQIKKDYQQKLKALKEHYELELQKLSSKPAQPSKSLPTKKVVKSAAPEEMTLELKPAPATDESVMDIPEPVPADSAL